MGDAVTRLKDAVMNYEMESIADLAKQALKDGVDPLIAIEKGLAEGIKTVGEKFGKGEIFLPELVMAAEAMKAGLAVLEPAVPKGKHRSSAGKVVIGTVQDDIHEIGKNLVSTMLTSNGFEVVDLGVNVPSNDFLKKADEHSPHMVAMSALMTTTMPRMAEIIAPLKKKHKTVKVLVGGAPVTDTYAKEIGADGYSGDASGAVDVARKLVR
ncbi:MAG TPA: corrinoid protein [Thermoplasmata archaeon]|jgi:corrinoid protein of di/trimethylamine methyltransferase